MIINTQDKDRVYIYSYNDISCYLTIKLPWKIAPARLGSSECILYLYDIYINIDDGNCNGHFLCNESRYSPQHKTDHGHTAQSYCYCISFIVHDIDIRRAFLVIAGSKYNHIHRFSRGNRRERQKKNPFVLSNRYKTQIWMWMW